MNKKTELTRENFLSTLRKVVKKAIKQNPNITPFEVWRLFGNKTATILQFNEFLKEINLPVGDIPNEPINMFTLWDENTELPNIYILGKNNNPVTEKGAENLAETLSEISGKTKPVIISVGDEMEIPKRAIKLGYYYPDAKKDKEEIFIKVENETLFLSGTDEYDEENSTWYGQRTGIDKDVKEFTTRAGTYHAINTFLNRYLGVIHAFAGEAGKHIPKYDNFALQEFEYRHIASTQFRTPVRFNQPGDNRGIDAISFQKFNNGYYGDHINVGGHQFKTVFAKCHPDAIIAEDYIIDGVFDEVAYETEKERRQQYVPYFALQDSGERSGWPFENKTVEVPTATGTKQITYKVSSKSKYETSHPNYPQFWYDFVGLPSIQKQPLKIDFPEGITDGWGRGISRDPNNVDHEGPNALKLILQTEGSNGLPVAKEEFAMTDRMMWYCQKLLEKVQENYPNHKISMGAYGSTLSEPKKDYPKYFLNKLIIRGVFNDFADPNLLTRAFDDYTFRELFDNWLDYLELNEVDEKVIVWRPNVGDSYGHSLGLYFNHINTLIPRFKEIIDRGVNGLMIDTLWGHYSTQWPLYYSLSAVCWDSRVDVDLLLEDAYNKLFGNASQHIKNYFEITEAQINNNLQHKITLEQLVNLWSPVIPDLENAIAFAKSSVEVGSIEHDRVLWTEAGLQWSKDVIKSAEYFLELNFGAIITGGNSAHNNNAIENNSNENEGMPNTNGWTASNNPPGSIFEAQNIMTNGSNSAFKMTSTGGSSRIVVRDEPFEGNITQTHITSIDVLVTKGEIGINEVDANGKIVKRLTIVRQSNEWKTEMFIVSGGHRLQIRDASGTDRPPIEAYFDNLKILKGRKFTDDEIEQKTNDWKQHNLNSISNIQPKKWDGVSDESLVSTPFIRPISTSAESRIPSPGSLDLGQDTGDLE